MADSPSIVIHLPVIEALKGILEYAPDHSRDHYWYTLRQAVSRKFGLDGIAYSSIRNCQALQPKGGLADGWNSGRKTWTRATVEEWCEVDDAGLQAYLDRVCPGRKVPPRIRSGRLDCAGTI